MGEVTREFAIAKTMEILRAYVRKIEDAKEYFDCLSPEGRQIVEDYDKNVDGQKTLLLKASESEDFFLGMSDEAVLAYADVCRKMNERFELNVKKVYPIERLAADKKGIWGALQGEFNENQTGSEIRGMNAVTQSKTGTEATMFHVGKNMDGAEFTDTMDDNDFNKSGEETSSEIIENSFKIIRQFEFTLNCLYIPIEGIGVITGSLFSVSCIFSNNSLKLFASGWYIGKNLVDSYTLSGTATLFVNGLKSEEKSFVLPDYNYLSTGEPYQTIGDAVFSRHFSKSDRIQIVLNFMLQICVDGGVNRGFYPYPSKRISI